MPSTFSAERITSVHGRRLGLSATGVIVDRDGMGAIVKSTAGVVQNSSALLFSQIGLDAQSAVASSVGSTLLNYGFISMASASATAISGHEIGTPALGVELKIHLDTSGSQVVFGGTSTAMVFTPAIVGAGSSLSVVLLPLAGTVITLMGFGSSEWAITSVGGTTAAVTVG